MSRGATRAAARLAAVQALYQMEIAGKGVTETLAEHEAHWLGAPLEDLPALETDAGFFRDVVSGVVREQRRLDPLIDAVLTDGWPLARVEAVLRAVLRAGAYELCCRSDVPAKVVVSEYVAVAHAFESEDVAAMANGVLDRLAREARPADFASKSR
jgi:N utilization substance protein B